MDLLNILPLIINLLFVRGISRHHISQQQDAPTDHLVYPRIPYTFSCYFVPPYIDFLTQWINISRNLSKMPTKDNRIHMIFHIIWMSQLLIPLTLLCSWFIVMVSHIIILHIMSRHSQSIIRVQSHNILAAKHFCCTRKIYRTVTIK
jgi:hypothetical protein